MGERFNGETLKKIGRRSAIGFLGISGVWLAGSNLYIGTSEKKYDNIVAGIGFGTAFLGGSVAYRNRERIAKAFAWNTESLQEEPSTTDAFVNQPLVIESKHSEGKLMPGFYELTYRDDPRFAEQEIELPVGENISLSQQE